VLLSVLVWLIGLTEPVVTVRNVDLSWRDIILIAGGAFLIAKATHEIHAEVEASHGEPDTESNASVFFWAIMQIIVIDMVFSLDSSSAIGMVQIRNHDRGGRDRRMSCTSRQARWRSSSQITPPPRCWRWPSWC
jgi:predicted tellurium resistance membrane protein TerC